jgi:hypothetical protein
MKFLIDHNIRGQAQLLFKAISDEGWLDLIELQFVTFDEVGLAHDSSDRLVWRLSQTRRLILLTANRSMKGQDSLEEVMREENTPSSLPVATIGNVDRIGEPDYRQRCVNRLIEIALYVDNYLGTRRIFIP